MSNYKKPPPIITEIKLRPEELEDVKRILEECAKHNNKGMIKYQPHTTKNAKIIIREKYYGGWCHICETVPNWKLTYKMDGITLIEYACDEHLERCKNL